MTEIISATPEQTKIIEKRIKQTEQYISRVEVVDIIDDNKNTMGQTDNFYNSIKMKKLDNEMFDKVFLHELAHIMIHENSNLGMNLLESKSRKFSCIGDLTEEYVHDITELICDCFAVVLYKTEEKFSPRLYAMIKGLFIKSVNQGRLELF